MPMMSEALRSYPGYEPARPEALSEVDFDALRRATRRLRRDPKRDRQLDAMLADGRSEIEVGKFASYCLQCETLSLKPWETPPCHVSGHQIWLEFDASSPEHAHRKVKEAQQLVRRLLRGGLSRYEPDPARALGRAKERA
jgi:hypothetical protein